VDAEVVLLTNVALEHTEVLGDTIEQIAKEKLAVAHAARVVVTSDNITSSLVPRGARVIHGGAREAAEAFLGRPIETEVEASLPGRLERHGDEVWDGAHTPEAVDWLLERLPGEHVLCVSILADKHIDEFLERLAKAGSVLVATRSSNSRALPEEQLAARAERYFDHVETIADPHEALARARDLGSPVLVTGSLYLLADLYS
jgi:dihydrofolate synthase/folylpolyglutamate synthase